MGARAINAVLGLWLFLSTFLWPHTRAQQMTGWVIGMVAVTAALAGTSGRTWGRSVNAVLGGWLIASAIVIPRVRAATFWTDLVVGFGLVLFAMLPGVTVVRNRRADI